MVREPARKNKWSLRYYMLFQGILWRLPNALHRKLLKEDFAIGAFANCKVPVLEVFVSTTTKGKILDTRAMIYAFGEEGRLLLDASEVVGLEFDRAASRSPNKKIVEIGPSLRARRWKVEHGWQPSEEVLKAVQSDLLPTGSRKHRARTVVDLLNPS